MGSPLSAQRNGGAWDTLGHCLHSIPGWPFPHVTATNILWTNPFQFSSTVSPTWSPDNHAMHSTLSTMDLIFLCSLFLMMTCLSWKESPCPRGSWEQDPLLPRAGFFLPLTLPPLPVSLPSLWLPISRRMLHTPLQAVSLPIKRKEQNALCEATSGKPLTQYITYT